MKKTLKLCRIIFKSPKAKLLCQNEVKKSKKKKVWKNQELNRTELSWATKKSKKFTQTERNSALAVMFNQANPVATYWGRKRQMCSFIAKLDETWL